MHDTMSYMSILICDVLDLMHLPSSSIWCTKINYLAKFHSNKHEAQLWYIITRN